MTRYNNIGIFFNVIAVAVLLFLTSQSGNRIFHLIFLAALIVQGIYSSSSTNRREYRHLLKIIILSMVTVQFRTWINPGNISTSLISAISISTIIFVLLFIIFNWKILMDFE